MDNEIEKIIEESINSFANDEDRLGEDKISEAIQEEVKHQINEGLGTAILGLGAVAGFGYWLYRTIKNNYEALKFLKENNEKLYGRIKHLSKLFENINSYSDLLKAEEEYMEVMSELDNAIRDANQSDQKNVSKVLKQIKEKAQERIRNNSNIVGKEIYDYFVNEYYPNIQQDMARFNQRVKLVGSMDDIEKMENLIKDIRSNLNSLEERAKRYNGPFTQHFEGYVRKTKKEFEQKVNDFYNTDFS